MAVTADEDQTSAKFITWGQLLDVGTSCTSQEKAVIEHSFASMNRIVRQKAFRAQLSSYPYRPCRGSYKDPFLDQPLNGQLDRVVEDMKRSHRFVAKCSNLRRCPWGPVAFRAYVVAKNKLPVVDVDVDPRWHQLWRFEVLFNKEYLDLVIRGDDPIESLVGTWAHEKSHLYGWAHPGATRKSSCPPTDHLGPQNWLAARQELARKRTDLERNRQCAPDAPATYDEFRHSMPYILGSLVSRLAK